MTTAVEYLVKEIIELTGVNIEMDEPIIEQALEIERLQQRYAFDHAFYYARSTDVSSTDAWNFYKNNLKSE